MHETYYYPQNLKAKATLWLWSLRDLVIIAIAGLLSILAWGKLHFPVPVVLTAVYAVARIRLGDFCVMDSALAVIRFFWHSQQYFEWKEERDCEESKPIHPSPAGGKKLFQKRH